MCGITGRLLGPIASGSVSPSATAQAHPRTPPPMSVPDPRPDDPCPDPRPDREQPRGSRPSVQTSPNRWLSRLLLPIVAITSLTTGALSARAVDGRCSKPSPPPAARPPIVVNGDQVWSGQMRGGIVPVGWTHSPAGAVAAATNYTVVLNSPLLFDDTQRSLAVDAIAAPAARERLQRSLNRTAKTLTAALTRGVDGTRTSMVVDPARLVFQAIPVRYHVDHYDAQHATVAIWMTGVAGYEGSSLPVQEAWGITTVQLEWAEGDWKETEAIVEDGPVPVADPTPPSSTSGLVGQAQRFNGYRYAPALAG